MEGGQGEGGEEEEGVKEGRQGEGREGERDKEGRNETPNVSYTAQQKKVSDKIDNVTKSGSATRAPNNNNSNTKDKTQLRTECVIEKRKEVEMKEGIGVRESVGVRESRTSEVFPVYVSASLEERAREVMAGIDIDTFFTQIETVNCDKCEKTDKEKNDERSEEVFGVEEMNGKDTKEEQDRRVVSGCLNDSSDGDYDENKNKDRNKMVEECPFDDLYNEQEERLHETSEVRLSTDKSDEMGALEGGRDRESRGVNAVLNNGRKEPVCAGDEVERGEGGKKRGAMTGREGLRGKGLGRGRGRGKGRGSITAGRSTTHPNNNNNDSNSNRIKLTVSEVEADTHVRHVLNRTFPRSSFGSELWKEQK